MNQFDVNQFVKGVENDVSKFVKGVKNVENDVSRLMKGVENDVNKFVEGVKGVEKDVNQFVKGVDVNQFRTLPSKYVEKLDVDALGCGPVNCAPTGAPAEENVETLFNAASKKNRADLGTFRSYHSFMGDSPIDELKSRINEFQSRGWLSQQEYRKYMALLETAPSQDGDDEEMEHVQSQLVEELDVLEEKMSGGTMLMKQTRMAVLTPRTSVTTPGAEQANQAAKTAPFAPLTNKLNNQKRSTSIMDPKDVADHLSEDQMADLFVETCFFARLGFIQPPCCLQCNYRESLKEATPNTKCGRWIVWRKDAKHILHPKYLQENTIMVQCHAARKLLAGKLVDYHKWDDNNKVLLQPPPPKSLRA